MWLLDIIVDWLLKLDQDLHLTAHLLFIAGFNKLKLWKY